MQNARPELPRKVIDIKLAPLQVSHAIVAITEYAKTLITDSELEPAGGEYEDYMIVQSIIQCLVKAKEQVTKGDN